MKLTALFFLFFTLNVSATGFGQEKINLRLKKTEISDVLRSIEKQTRYRFLYNNNLEDIRYKVNINVKDAALNEVLELVLQRTKLQYQLMNDNLIVIKEDPNVAPDVTIRGVVTGENDVPLTGASVQIKGTTTGTTTGTDGSFSLNAPNANVTLVISSVGYEDQEVSAANKEAVNVSLVKSTKVMEQVIVVGYGSQRKMDVTGSIATIKGDEISKQPSVNPMSGLQGKVAGVQITNLGAPGSAPEIRIRGLGTVYGNANPLYVVDGVWFDDITFLNPADIETISILKDASSESIYGIRAANGVVLITTKKGARNSKPVINYNGYIGNQVVTNQVDMANGPEYAQMINELDKIGYDLAKKNANDPNYPPFVPRYANPAGYGTTDWFHQVLRNALISNHQVSVSGGGEKSAYNFSLGYLSQDGLIKTNRFDRYTIKLQNDFQVASFLKVGYIITGSMNNSNDANTGLILHQAFAALPIVPVFYADGTYGDPNDFQATSSANFNPEVSIDYYKQKSKYYRLTGTAYADLKFAKHFTFHTNIGGDYGQKETRNFNPVYSATLIQRNSVSNLTLTTGSVRDWILENTLTYTNKFGDHNITILAGQGAQSYQYRQSIASADNVPGINTGNYYLSLGNNYRFTDVDPNTNNPAYPLSSTVASYFGRINYSFQNKYLLTATMRADGSSKFTGSQRWGYFPSVGVGWVLTNEDFMKDQHIFNNLKLRGSWGKVGNVSVPANLSELKVTQTPAFTYVGGNGSTAPGASVNTLVTPTTYWERGVGTDIGLEASLLNSKLYTEIGFYNKKTEKAIFDIPVLGSIGTTGSSIIGNQATFQNQGLEFLVTWKDQIRNGLTYSLSANLATNNNKVLDVSTGANPIYQAVGTTGSNNFNTRTIVGQPIGQFYGLQVMGIFQSDADILNYKNKDGDPIMPGASPGDFIMRDVNEDGKIDDKDRVVLGNPNPKLTYGFNTSFGYKQFDLALDFQGLAGVDVYDANTALRFGTENYTKDFYDHRWHGAGTSNEYPSPFLAGGQNSRSNSFYVQNGNYFRIRNIQLGYTFASSMVRRWSMSQLRVYAGAQNPFTFFKYRGFTPEIGGGATRAGVDYNVYPLSAIYNVGVNVTF
ncbi:MAG: TonB-dependent receptor [Chitinophagaceae bacterium]